MTSLKTQFCIMTSFQEWLKILQEDYEKMANVSWADLVAESEAAQSSTELKESGGDKNKDADTGNEKPSGAIKRKTRKPRKKESRPK